MAFAVLLLTGASLGDRFGRKLMLAIGMGIFAVASIGAALAPGVEVLVAAHAVQGVGGAIVAPLTLTIPSCFDTRGRLTLKMSAIAPCDLSSPRALPFEPCVGVHDAAWLSHFEHIIGEGSQHAAVAAGLIEVARSAGWWPFDHALVLTGRPSARHPPPIDMPDFALVVVSPDGWRCQARERTPSAPLARTPLDLV